MADLQKHLEFLQTNYVLDGQLREKDILKQESFDTYQRKIGGLFLFPLGFQAYQLTLINNPAKVGLYNTVQKFKWIAFALTVSLGVHEYIQLGDKWRFINRAFPEATEYQKTLELEALMHKERRIEEEELRDGEFMDQETRHVYDQMYQLPKDQTGGVHPDINGS